MAGFQCRHLPFSGYVTDVSLAFAFTYFYYFAYAPLYHKFLVMEPMKMISNASIKARIRQVVILVILIVIGIAISKIMGY